MRAWICARSSARRVPSGTSARGRVDGADGGVRLSEVRLRDGECGERVRVRPGARQVLLEEPARLLETPPAEREQGELAAGARRRGRGRQRLAELRLRGLGLALRAAAMPSRKWIDPGRSARVDRPAPRLRGERRLSGVLGCERGLLVLAPGLRRRARERVRLAAGPVDGEGAVDREEHGRNGRHQEEQAPARFREPRRRDRDERRRSPRARGAAGSRGCAPRGPCPRRTSGFGPSARRTSSASEIPGSTSWTSSILQPRGERLASQRVFRDEPP